MESSKQLFWQAWADEQVRMTLETFLKLGVAALLGGVIGSERQHSHRAAGLRTHMLVAVGAALVMCTSVYVAGRYAGQDVMRLGAQVISGIGLLGAGTIIREGFSVKGLTTAASLWAVACIGLAVGIGFWPGALIATAAIYFTLNYVKKVARRRSSIRTLYIGVSDAYHVSEKVAEIFRVCGANLRSLEIIFPEEGNDFFVKKEISKALKARAYVNNEQDLSLIRESLLGLEGVLDFDVEN